MFPAALLDYNGVLVDDEAIHLEAFREVLAPHGVVIEDSVYWDTYIGFDDVYGFRAMLTDGGREATDALVAELVEAKRAVYRRRAGLSLQGFAGAADLVRRCARSGPVVVVSGALREEIELGLDVLGVRSAVEAIVAAEDTTRSKPDPEGYERGRSILESVIGASARHALVVEDSIAGIEAARAANLACVAVAQSYTADQLRKARPDSIVDTVADLTDAMLSELYERLHA